MNFLLGKYMAFSFNDPQKYPDKPFLEREKQRDMTEAEMEKIARYNTILMGGKINGNHS